MKGIHIGYLVISLLLVLTLGLGAGCTLQRTVSTPQTPVSGPTVNATPIDTESSIPISESLGQTLPSIADVVAAVKPSVVAITTEVITFDFFNRPSTQEGAGSGWIIREDGIIITNNHVVEGAETITITLDDGRTFSAETVRTDPITDLAVVKIDAENLPAAKVGNSASIRIGDWVVAIGNSLGLGIRATTGIISATGVRLEAAPGQTLYDLVQTDAAINPGNSGGPLVNMAGEVIGITSAKFAAVEVEGVGYAISTSGAVPIIQQLISEGYVVRPWLGVVLYTVDQFAIMRYELAIENGALIVHVAPDSPAEVAELLVGDVIVNFDGKEIANTEELIKAIHAARIGQTVEIVYWRGETESTTFATLVEKPVD
jgi:serine protease Do